MGQDPGMLFYFTDEEIEAWGGMEKFLDVPDEQTVKQR